MLCNAYDDMASFSYHNTRGVTAHPRKRLDRGVVDGPQTIATETRGEREGYTYCLLSLELLIPT
jgi:hypothetical protein